MIQDGLHLIISDSSKTLKPFLDTPSSKDEVFYLRLSGRTNVDFRRTPKNSYYMGFECARIEADVNNLPAIAFDNFEYNFDVVFCREINNNLPVKQTHMVFE